METAEDDAAAEVDGLEAAEDEPLGGLLPPRPAALAHELPVHFW